MRGCIFLRRFRGNTLTGRKGTVLDLSLPPLPCPRSRNLFDECDTPYPSWIFRKRRGIFYWSTRRFKLGGANFAIEESLGCRLSVELATAPGRGVLIIEGEFKDMFLPSMRHLSPVDARR